MRVFVTGGGGFLGRHLVSALLARGDSVRALVLPSSDATWLERRGVAVFRGDVRHPATLTSMHGADAVVHLAATIGMRRPLAEHHAVNVTGTANVCRAALAAHVGRVVHVSSTSVYRLGAQAPIGEDEPLDPSADPYAQTKAAADQLVQRMIANAHLPATIVRLSTVFGPGDELNFGRIADRLRAGRAIVVGNGLNAVSFAYVSDVVDGLLLALDRERAAGQVYNITDDECPTQLTLLRSIAEAVGAQPPRIHVPYGLLFGAAHVAERVAGLTRNEHPLVTPFGVALYGAETRYRIDKARHDLGYGPRVSLRAGIRLTAAWYRESRASAPVVLPAADFRAKIAGGGR